MVAAKKMMRGSPWLADLNLARFSGILFVFSFSFIYSLYIQIDKLAQTVEERAFDVHVLGSIPGVCILLFSSYFSADPMHHSSRRLPCNLNVQPLDALLPRSNASSLKVHGARSSQRLHLIQRGQLGLSFVGPKFRFSPPSSAMQTGPNLYFLSLFIFFNYFPFFN